MSGPASGVSPASGAATRARILVVDDEAAQMKALCDTLRGRGYDVSGYSLPTDALTALRGARFDLLLTDIQMPEMDGISLLKAASALDPDIVGIIMTGHATLDTAIDAVRSGAFDYIQKPFKLSVALPAIVRALDVTRLRRENAALLQHLQERSSDLERANSELQQANGELEAFSYSVAHDLRGPLRAVNGFAAMLVEDHAPELSADAMALLDRVMAGANRMGALIDDLLGLSRVSRQPLNMTPVRMRPLIEGVLDELKEANPGRHVEISVGPLPDAVGDQALLRQVFVNLLSNAFKFTRGKDPARIEVSGSREGGETRYVVRDNGAGFDMKHAGRMFGVFQRMHAMEQFEGTGIGLSIVHRILVRHGGQISATAKIDAGAEFFLSLPAPTP